MYPSRTFDRMEAKNQTEEPTVGDRIRRLAGEVGFDDTDFVVQLYEQVNDDGTYHDNGIPAVVYAAVRIRGEPIKPAEVVDAYDGDIGKSRLTKDTRNMVDELPFDVDITGVERRYVERYADDLNFDDDTRDKALSMCEAGVEAGLSNGKAPSAFAGAVVYAAASVAGTDLTQDEVAEVANTSSTVVRRHYKDVIDAATASDGEDSYVERIIGDLGDLPDVVADEAASILSYIEDVDEGWSRRCSPAALNASVVYVAAQNNRVDVSQREVAEAANISRHTVKERVKEVRHADRRRCLGWRDYNELKELAAEHDVDVGMTPERDELINALANEGVEL